MDALISEADRGWLEGVVEPPKLQNFDIITCWFGLRMLEVLFPRMSMSISMSPRIPYKGTAWSGLYNFSNPVSV